MLVAPRDPAGLAAAIAGLLEDPAERQRLAAAGLARLNEFTVEAVAARYGQLYEALTAEVRR